MLIQIFLVVLLDRITKFFITHTMTVGMSFPVIPGVVSCTYVLNPGAAFGLLEYQRVFFVVITLLAAGAVFYFRDHIHREGPKARLGTGLFLGGALGNLIDRIATGYVIDFVDFHFWPVFNVADIFICVGVGLIVWSMLENETGKTRQPEPKDKPGKGAV
ncbi:signal peptidase II [Acidaminococcus sp.]|uniref:signal peptidase II n=1 Tax=Acidaminococcus sp. TaxID=1872103 RepID=UPI003522DE8E